MEAVTTIILAGGQGTRLYPLTLHHCKPGICFGGRYRLIDVPISNAIHSGYRKIYVIAQYLSAELIHHISQTYHFGMFQSGCIDVITPEEKSDGTKLWFEGTADAVRKNLSTLLKEPSEWLLLLSGDQLYNIDFRDMVSLASRTNADCVIAAIRVPKEETKRFGILKVDQEGKILDFVEKPQHPDALTPYEQGPAYLASMGIYVFRKDYLVKLLETDAREDFGKHLLPSAIPGANARCFIYGGYWEDIGTVLSYYQANLGLTTDLPGLDVYDERRPIYTRTTFLPGPRVISAKVSQSVLCEGSFIEAAEIHGSIVGLRSRIRRGSILNRSILLGNHNRMTRELPENIGIGENCLIEKSIIDEHVCIGPHCRLVNERKLDHFDGPGVYIRDGIIIVTAGTVLPPHFIL